MRRDMEVVVVEAQTYFDTWGDRHPGEKVPAEVLAHQTHHEETDVVDLEEEERKLDNDSIEDI